jgi:FkbM family methyltransferase
VLSRDDIKIWMRSRSWKFMRNSRSRRFGSGVEKIGWCGNDIFYRPGTSDATIIYEVLIRPPGTYWMPDVLNPSTILDIGGNIGVASMFLARRFPQAQIFAFEPVPENFDLLLKNTSGCQNVKAFPIALGKKNDLQEIFTSSNPKNYGGYSFFENESNRFVKKNVPIRNAGDFLKEMGISKVDVIKIDTEGAEYDILTAIDPEMLRSVQWIAGELHGMNDFKLLAYLAQWFDLSVKKPLKKQHFMFNACNKSLTAQVEKLIEFK